MQVHVLGIRHHGIGSAKQVLSRLEQLRPDMVLVEGPPEMDELLSYIGLPDLVPPVAIMMYKQENPGHSCFYPFMDFSPEWVAALYANRERIQVRAIDIPAKFSLKYTLPENREQPLETKQEESIKNSFAFADPLQQLAEIAGFPDSESWWEYQFENVNSINSAEQHFEAVLNAMAALREEIQVNSDHFNEVRESFMRQSIRQAQSEMYQNIVVVCGAWHAPALTELNANEKSDLECIRHYQKSKETVYASWIPWTNERLSLFSGYGAGITSPGWYLHQWQDGDNSGLKWLSKVGIVFRNEGLDISSAHVIESYRLAVSLSQLRNKPMLMLQELNESILTVMCMGDHILLELIRKELIVGDSIGTVPDDTPKVPLQVDFEKETKRLKIKLLAYPKTFELDLRRQIDLERSILFHRLAVLSIPWATLIKSRTKGTFKESWTVTWQPEMMISLIDKSFLGNTIESSATQEVSQQAQSTTEIKKISSLLGIAIPAELNGSIDVLLNRLDELSSISTDISDLMEAVPNLVYISRYGSVRKSDLATLDQIVHRLLTRIIIGLPTGCYGLDEENSNHFFELISNLNHSLRIYESDSLLKSWYEMLLKIVDKDGVHDIIQGCVCRLLLDAEILSQAETTLRMSQALSASRDPKQVASWMEGFLRGSGMILIYDHRLWNLVYNWVASLQPEIFFATLPYIKRAFSRFQFGERRQIGEKAKQGLVNITEEKFTHQNEDFSLENMKPIFDTIQMLMGRETKTSIVADNKI